MAYTDYEFYTNKYFGDVVPETDFPKYAERASNRIDRITFDRIAHMYPDDSKMDKKIQEATCAVAEALYQIDIAKRASMEAFERIQQEDGTVTGKVVSSVSSGSESRTYATGSSGNASNIYAQAAMDKKTENMVIYQTSVEYLSGVTDDEGKMYCMQDCNVNILGTDYHVIFKNGEEDKRLYKVNGYTDPTIKEIVVNDLKANEEDEMAVKNMEAVRRSALRHEIIHAFLYESGLWSDSATVETWGMNEEITDWIALQTPKMFRAFWQVGALTATEIPCDEKFILSIQNVDASVIRSGIIRKKE